MGVMRFGLLAGTTGMLRRRVVGLYLAAVLPVSGTDALPHATCSHHGLPAPASAVAESAAMGGADERAPASVGTDPAGAAGPHVGHAPANGHDGHAPRNPPADSSEPGVAAAAGGAHDAHDPAAPCTCPGECCPAAAVALPAAANLPVPRDDRRGDEPRCPAPRAPAPGAPDHRQPPATAPPPAPVQR